MRRNIGELARAPAVAFASAREMLQLGRRTPRLSPPSGRPARRRAGQGVGLASMETLRPQAVMSLCEILHHCRKSLSLDQLARVVRLMTAFVVDQARFVSPALLCGGA